MWSVVTIVMVISWIWYHVKYRKFRELSVRLKTDFKAWPLIGHAHIMFGNSVDRMKGVQKLGMEANKHGGLTYMWLGSYYAVVVTDPLDLDVITKTCLDKGNILDFLRDFFGSGSVIAPVSVWRPRRKFLASIFTAKNLNSFVSVFAEKSSIMVDHLRSEVGKGAFTFWQYITTFSMDSLCETTLGITIDTKSKKHQSFLKSFDVCMGLSAERMFKPLLQVNLIFRRLRRYKTFLASKNVMYDFIHKIIESKRKTLQNVNKKSVYGDDDEQVHKGWKSILELQIVSGDKYGFTDKVIGEETLVLVLAGTESSANCLAYTAVLLAQHPQVQEKVFKEIQEVLGDSEGPITAEDLPKLKYTDAVLRESLRLYPPFPVTVRKVTEEVTLRYQYAMMSMKTAVATLLRHYRLLPASPPDRDGEHPPLSTEYNFIMKDIDRYKIKLEPRFI